VAWSFATEAATKNAAAYTKADGAPDYDAAFRDSFYDDIINGLERMHSIGTIDSTPLIEGETLYVGSWDGQLYAIG